MIVIGLGTGRSGTASLANLLLKQTDAHCFHEMNPTCVRFFGTPRPILNGIDEYQAILDGGDPSKLIVDLSRQVVMEAYDKLCKTDNVKLIGDIAFYYLSYVEAIAERNPNVRFVCLKRDKEKTVRSWLHQASLVRWLSKRIGDRISDMITRQIHYKSRNFWMEHDGTEWLLDPVWDKCFPKFPGPTIEEAVNQYWDYYYEEAERLEKLLPDVFRIYETEKLGDHKRQTELLSFCGIPPEEQIYDEAHLHKKVTA